MEAIAEGNKVSFNIEHILSEAPFRGGMDELGNAKNAISNNADSRNPTFFKSAKYNCVRPCTNQIEFKKFSCTKVFDSRTSDSESAAESMLTQPNKSNPCSSPTQTNCRNPSAEARSSSVVISDEMLEERKVFDVKNLVLKETSCADVVDVPSSSLQAILTNNMTRTQSFDIALGFNGDQFKSQSQNKFCNSSLFSNLFAAKSVPNNYSQIISGEANPQQTAVFGDDETPFKNYQVQQHYQAFSPQFIPYLGCYKFPSYLLPFTTFSSFFPQYSKPKILMNNYHERWKNLATEAFSLSSAVQTLTNGPIVRSNTISTARNRQRKMRTVFDDEQLKGMEKEFKEHPYLGTHQRAALAASLKLSDTQVKTWFQNRRMKEKKNKTNNADSFQVEKSRPKDGGGTIIQTNINANANLTKSQYWNRK